MITDPEVSRDGFTYAFGELYAIGHIPRIEGDRLKEMFLPTMSEEAKAAVRSEFHFARAQLQHYGVECSPSGFAGNGLATLKEALRAGKCDQVPDNILKLKSEMHTEWLKICPDKVLATSTLYPRWILEKYFTNSWGLPEPSRTKGVVGPLPYNSLQAVGAGVPDVLYLGWDSMDVRVAAFHHDDTGEEEDDDSQSQGESQSDGHLRAPSPAGKYDIECDIITRQFSIGSRYDKDFMTMHIRATRTPGLYQATFNFDAMEGVMMLSTNEALLKAFVYDDCTDSGDDSDALRESGSVERLFEMIARKRITKRKRRIADASGKRNGPAAKKTKKGSVGRPSRYFFLVRCRDLGNDRIWNMGKGTLKFDGPGLTGFTGQGDMGGIADDLVFSGRKVVRGGGGLREDSDDEDDKDYVMGFEKADTSMTSEETDSGDETDSGWATDCTWDAFAE
ncbi:hypothetical protein QBC39DRAFT_379988 [Podospora conica]|nr:hypothetical protein QBC39DRAFT_379988 [Schizothecium conicum]